MAQSAGFGTRPAADLERLPQGRGKAPQSLQDGPAAIPQAAVELPAVVALPGAAIYRCAECRSLRQYGETVNRRIVAACRGGRQ